MDAPGFRTAGSIRRAKAYVLGPGLGPFLVRATAGTGAVHIAAMAATFGVGVLLARGLGVEGYGQYAIALAVISLAGIPGELGIPRLVVRETAAALARKDWSGLFGVLRWADRSCIAVSAAVAVVVATATLVFSGAGDALGAAILWGVPIIPIFALAKIRGAALQGLHQVPLGQTVSTLARPLLLALLLGFFLLAGTALDAADAMALNALTAFAALGAGQVWLRNRLPPRTIATPVRNGRAWIASAIPLGMSEGLLMLEAQLAVLFLGLVASAVEVGLFRIAASTAVALIAPIFLVSAVVSPQLSRLHASGDVARLQRLVAFAARAQFAIVLLLSLPLLLAGEEILALVFGSEFAAAAGPLRLMLLGHIASSAFGVNVPLLNMTGQERRVTRAMAVALVLNLIVLTALAPDYASYGAAAAFVVSIFTWNLLTHRDARRLLNIETSVLGRR